MENLKRKLFFWVLVALFLITAPVVVLRARGYRFDLKRGVFVYSGTISFKSNPQNLKVILNGELNESKQLNRINSSFNISSLLPGEYDIKVAQDGYSSWSKKTEVHSGLASEFWNILLVRNEYEKTAYEAENVGRFFISPQNKFIAYSQNLESELGVKILNLSSEKTEQSFSFPDWKIISEDKKENIEWSPEEDYLSIPVEKDITREIIETKTVGGRKLPGPKQTVQEKQYNYFIADPQNETSFNLNEFLGKDSIRDVRWDPKEKKYLFFLEGSNLFRANIADKNDLTLISTDVATFDLSRDALYFATSPNSLAFKTSFDGHSEKKQITSYFPESGNVISKIIVYDDTRIAFIDTNKNLFIYNKGDKDTYFKKLGSSIEGMHFSDDGKKILFWSNYELSVYFTRIWEVQPTRAEDELATITRYSEPIKNVQWFKDYEHIIFSTARFTKIIELDGRDHRNCMDLVNTSTEEPFIRYNSYLEKLYFTDVENGKTVLESIDFPETVPLLGIGG